MTVIAGASLFNGVMLLSDCRTTITWPGGKSDVHADIAQKIFPLTLTTAIGFSGDGQTAARLIKNVYYYLRHRKRVDAVSMNRWLPRFLRFTYRNISRKHRVAPLSFLVASVVPDHPNIIERRKVHEFMEIFRLKRSPIQRNFIPDVVVRIIMMPAEARYIAIPGTVRGLLYAMDAPDFIPRHVEPLNYHAIGSGEGTIREIDKIADWLLAGQPGNDLIEAMALRDAVSEFIAAEGIVNVGGMFPCLKVDHRGVTLLGHSMGLPGEQVSVCFDPTRGRWSQSNDKTGKRMELMPPWEIDPSKIKTSILFDDWADATRSFNPRRLQRRIP
ncbi:MAG: hypothetical protein WA265_05530 [Rhodomicrobium sp.]